MEKIYSLADIQERLKKTIFHSVGLQNWSPLFLNFIRPSFYAVTTIHAGSRVRPDILKAMQVSKEDRCREEDPDTDHKRFFYLDYRPRLAFRI